VRDRRAIGAGTVLTTDDVGRAREAGATMIVAPNTDRAVIAAAVDAGMTPYPGVATPSEAFAAIAAGARHLKLFPADAVGIKGVAAWRAVLPRDVELLPVGGIDETNLAAWAAAVSRERAWVPASTGRATPPERPVPEPANSAASGARPSAEQRTKPLLE
jgi:2-keto-3-deoxy-6-phosphogluconate aldolase